MNLPSPPATMLPLEVVRLKPGDDLRGALEAVFRRLHAEGLEAACVVSAVGSLSCAVLRYAAEPRGAVLAQSLELVTLSGTLSPDGPHLHASVATAQGEMRGGHVMPGCVVRTTAEIVLAPLAGWAFRRVHDAETGYPELLARRMTQEEPQHAADAS